MDNIDGLWGALQESIETSLARMAEYLPMLLAAIAVMLVGWVAARLIRAVILRSGAALSRGLQRLGWPVGSTRLRLSGGSLVLAASLVYWILILLFAAAAARVAGLEAFSVWLDELVSYVPTLIAGLLIGLVGYLLSSLVRDVVTATLVSVGRRETDLVGVTAQAAVLLTAVVIGLDQIGIDVTFLIILVSVALGGVLLSVAVAFGLGARDFVGNLIAARQVRGTFEPGCRARLGDIEGRVLDVNATTVVLASAEGRVFVPAALFQTRAAAILSEETDD